jgi:hypothetical protein
MMSGPQTWATSARVRAVRQRSELRGTVKKRRGVGEPVTVRRTDVTLRRAVALTWSGRAWSHVEF